MTKKVISKKITLVHSEKGGAGKSYASILLGDTLLNLHKKVIIVDADQSNADVHRFFQAAATNQSLETGKREVVEIYQFDLGLQAGWWDLYNVMSKNYDEDIHIVVSLPSQIEFVLADQHKELKKALSDLGYKLNMIWMLTESLDSIQLLKLTVANNGDLIDKLVVCKNGFFNDEDQFQDFDNSKLKIELLTNANYVVTYLPSLNRRLKSALRLIKNTPYSQVLKSGGLQYSERLGLDCWLQTARAIFTTII